MVVANGKFAVLPGKEMLLLQRMSEIFPRVATKESLLEWMYQFAGDGDEPEIKIIDVFVCKMRKKLEPIGIRIDTLWGRGYALAVNSKPLIVKEAA